MRIKFTLHRAAQPVDLVAVVDSSTTIGDLASYLVRADPHASVTGAAAAGVTLALSTGGLAMDPRQTVLDSGLRSGATVLVSQPGVDFADPHRAAAAIVRVLAGPDQGAEFPIARGTTIVGRERGCDIRLTDPLVSRRHARINVTDDVEVIDLGSANGVIIDDVAVPRTLVGSADTVRIGDSVLAVRVVGVTHTDTDADEAAVGFVRPPRLDPQYEGSTFAAPEPPERPHPGRLPLIPMLAPILFGVLLYLITRNPTSFLFVALSPVMMIGNAVESRLSGRSAYKRALQVFRADVEELVAELTAAAEAEQQGRNAEHPATADCLDAARNASPLLWTRRPDQRGYAEIRLGLGSLPSRNRVELPSTAKAARALHRELAERTAPYAHVAPVPVVGELRSTAIGLGGPRTAALPAARAVLAQLAALHSPAELIVTALVSTQSAADWDWIKWLPHTSSPHSPLTVRHLASTAASGAALTSELEDLVDQRSKDDRNTSARADIVLLVEDDAPVERSRLVELAEQGPSRGVHIVWVAPETARLPAACQVFVDVSREPGIGAVGFVHTGSAVTPVQLEQITAADALELARRLAPMVDLGARVNDASDLPRTVSLLALNGPELATAPDAVIERWTENRSILTGPFAPDVPARHAGSLRAVIGQAAGEVLALDLRADGPHALVGGTTGSGKSELLQAWILAMAAAHSPQRLTFLLVDYKGGSAFRDCVALPHTVGLVTDLSPHLVRRALTSLAAELTYREQVLAQHAAKDLMELEKQGVPGAPPSLVIVVDEFAALVHEVPEFVDGVVNVAQRGRSLGLHLILATQRPAGVIKDNLRANTNLRLALRMADEADSSDVLGSPEAAFFDPAIPGRAVSKTGPGRLVPFQSGYAGGWTRDVPAAPDIHVEELTLGVGMVWEPREPESTVGTDLGPTDIRRLVASVRQASERAELPLPRKPWLPELRTVYDLADQSSVPTRRTDAELVFGVRDDPQRQAQPTVAFHPDRDGNLAVYGAGGSGKSTLLRTLAIAAGFTVRGGPCHVYAIDFGARGLTMLEPLPHVGAVISGSEHERITRLLGWLRSLIDERSVRYSRANAGTITEYRRLSGTDNEPRILLLVDGMAAFRQAYESTDRLRWFDTFTSIAADGRAAGVHVVVTSDQRGGLTTALASAMQARLVMRMAAEDDYGMLGVPSDVLSPTSPPGRAVVLDSEVQVAVLGGTSDVLSQARAVTQFAEAMGRSIDVVAPPIGSLPESISLGQLEAGAGDAAVIGMASSTLAPVAIPTRGTFLVSGPPGSGRTTALHTIALAMRRLRPAGELYLIAPARSTLTGLQVWTASAGSDPTEFAGQLADRLRRADHTTPAVVVIEGVADHVNGPADVALQELLKVCADAGHLVVAEGETSTLSSSYGLLGAVKASRAGLALQPDQGDGPTLYRTNFPRINRAEYPVGRGLLVGLGKTEIIQVAQPPQTGATGESYPST